MKRLLGVSSSKSWCFVFSNFNPLYIEVLIIKKATQYTSEFKKFCESQNYGASFTCKSSEELF